MGRGFLKMGVGDEEFAPSSQDVDDDDCDEGDDDDGGGGDDVNVVGDDRGLLMRKQMTGEWWMVEAYQGHRQPWGDRRK